MTVSQSIWKPRILWHPVLRNKGWVNSVLSLESQSALHWIICFKRHCIPVKIHTSFVRCKCSGLKNGSEADGKSTQVITLCHLSLQSKSLHWTLLLPCCLKQETDCSLENTLKLPLSCFHMNLGDHRKNIYIITNYRGRICKLHGYQSWLQLGDLLPSFCIMLSFWQNSYCITILLCFEEFKIFITPWIF